ncbi:MFS transporter [Massilia sp. CF038]|uniref:MFS transporter n=1 Tax=Massilia sp. CF038 TaxID=1881045 RepID=UPI0015B43A3A|nr:MFS transporter [Massilia sp. CF038]
MSKSNTLGSAPAYDHEAPSPAVHVALLTTLFAIGPVAFQIFLPALPGLSADFHASSSVLALTVSLATLSFALAALTYGGLADKFGRRPTILIGMSLLTFGSLLGAFAPSMEVLLLARVLQSAGGAAGIVVSRAIVVDVYHGSEIARVMSRLVAAMMIAPMLATPVGGAISDAVGWRGNFVATAVLAAMTLLLSLRYLPETRKAHTANSAHGDGLFAGCGQLLRSRAYLGFTANNALFMAANTVFLAAAPLLLATQYKLTSFVIGVIYILGALMFALGAYASARLPDDAFPAVVKAALLACVASAAALGLALGGVWTVAAIVLPAAVVSFVVGFTGPTVQSGAVSAIPGMQGKASGMLMFLSSALTAAMIQLEARLSDGSPVPLTAIVALCCFGAVVALVTAPRR